MYVLSRTLKNGSLRDEQRHLTKRRIADAAKYCFYEHGVQVTSMDQIARAAEVSRATLYLHFANKDAILLELLGSNLRAVRTVFDELRDPDMALTGDVRAWLTRYVAMIAAQRSAMRLFHIGLANDPEARALVDDHRDLVVDMLCQRIPALVDDIGLRTHALLIVARIDHVASAATEDAPRIDVNAGIELAAAELAEFLGSVGAVRECMPAI